MKIDWENLWEQFDGWCDDSDEPSWENQKKQIEMLVEEQLSHQPKSYW